MKTPPVTVEEVTGDILKTLEDAFYDIPFENSDFQTRAFVVAAQQTPARAYRAIGLRMFAKIQAIKEYKYSQAKQDIDIEELEHKIADPATGEYDRRRAMLDATKFRDDRRQSDKLLNDALRELSCLHAEFIKYPRYTREQFEAEEPQHFAVRLHRQLTAPGANESVRQMTEDLPQMDERIRLATAKLLGVTP